MTIGNKKGSRKTLSTAIGGAGLFLALALAGAGFQGCTTEEKATGPAGTDTPAAATLAEDEMGADLNADGSPVNPELSDVSISQPALAKAAPSCVTLLPSRTVRGYRYAKVKNECPYSVRIRFIWRFNLDGECVHLDPKWGGVGAIYEENRSWPSSFTEVRSC
jgi:hypothetical protein